MELKRDLELLVAGGVVFLLLVVGLAAVAVSNPIPQKGKVAVIDVTGAIKPSSQGFRSQGVTPETVRELNRKATKRGVSAIIYEINSGGGAVVASKEVKRAIESVEVPTVCRIRDIGASGAYLASLGCDRIVADSVSLTGSIGVKASYMEFSGLLNKLGIEYVNVTSGKYKDAGSRYRNVTDEQKELLEQKVDRVHQEFVQVVGDERNLSSEEVEKIETGEAFLGERSRELGLVDRLGGRQTSIEVAENLTGKRLETVKIESEPPFSLLSLLSARIGLPGIQASAPLESRYR